jgi:hypothetical protein
MHIDQENVLIYEIKKNYFLNYLFLPYVLELKIYLIRTCNDIFPIIFPLIFFSFFFYINNDSLIGYIIKINYPSKNLNFISLFFDFFNNLFRMLIKISPILTCQSSNQI